MRPGRPRVTESPAPIENWYRSRERFASRGFPEPRQADGCIRDDCGEGVTWGRKWQTRAPVSSGTRLAGGFWIFGGFAIADGVVLVEVQEMLVQRLGDQVVLVGVKRPAGLVIVSDLLSKFG